MERQAEERTSPQQFVNLKMFDVFGAVVVSDGVAKPFREVNESSIDDLLVFSKLIFEVTKRALQGGFYVRASLRGRLCSFWK